MPGWRAASALARVRWLRSRGVNEALTYGRPAATVLIPSAITTSALSFRM